MVMNLVSISFLCCVICDCLIHYNALSILFLPDNVEKISGFVFKCSIFWATVPFRFIASMKIRKNDLLSYANSHFHLIRNEENPNILIKIMLTNKNRTNTHVLVGYSIGRSRKLCIARSVWYTNPLNPGSLNSVHQGVCLYVRLLRCTNLFWLIISPIS